MSCLDFDQKVLELTKKIPKGRVTTYKAIANKLGTKAYRAVGNALKKNPYSPKAPCHRVVNSDGNVGGYKGIKNSKEKIKLLRKENIGIKKNKIADLKRFLWK